MLARDFLMESGVYVIKGAPPIPCSQPPSEVEMPLCKGREGSVDLALPLVPHSWLLLPIDRSRHMRRKQPAFTGPESSSARYSQARLERTGEKLTRKCSNEPRNRGHCSIKSVFYFYHPRKRQQTTLFFICCLLFSKLLLSPQIYSARDELITSTPQLGILARGGGYV